MGCDGQPTALTVQGTSISQGIGTIAAIDTGTTNIAGPSSAIQAIYAQIQGSSAASGQWAGYYQYRTSPSTRVFFSYSPPTSSLPHAHSLLYVGHGRVFVWRKHVDDEFGRLYVHGDQLDRVYRCVFRDQFNDDEWFDAVVDHRGCVPGEYWHFPFPINLPLSSIFCPLTNDRMKTHTEKRLFRLPIQPTLDRLRCPV